MNQQPKDTYLAVVEESRRLKEEMNLNNALNEIKDLREERYRLLAACAIYEKALSWIEDMAGHQPKCMGIELKFCYAGCEYAEEAAKAFRAGRKAKGVEK